MFFNDDFWGALAVGVIGVVAYSCGKNKGELETVAKYNAQDVINSQQKQINELNAKLNVLSGRQR